MFRFIFCVLALLALLVSCNTTDKTLLAELQQHVSTFTQVTADSEKAVQTSKDIQTLFEHAPPALLSEPNSPLAQLKDQSNMIANRLVVREIDYKEVSQKLQKILQDYIAGKLTSEEVKRELHFLETRIKDAPDFLVETNRRLADIKEKAEALLK